MDVTVYERSGAELQQRGAGIGFLPTAYLYLTERARIDLDEISISTKYIRYLDRQGCVIYEQYQPYRFSNWNTVYRLLLRCFGRERYLLGHECCGIEPEAGTVQIRRADGEELEFDLLVCADGVNSTARACLLREIRAAYAGYVAFRGLLPERDLGGEPEAPPVYPGVLRLLSCPVSGCRRGERSAIREGACLAGCHHKDVAMWTSEVRV